MGKIIILIMVLVLSGSAAQQDLKGISAIEVTKEFIGAIVHGDKSRVEELTGGSGSLLQFIYADANSLARAKKMLQTINPNSWKQINRTNGSIEVRAEASDGNQKFPIVFELVRVKDYNGKQRLYVSDLH